jgi:hypothetical protein
MVWTIAILLPFAPFSYLQPIIVGGSAGTWLLLSYVLFATIPVFGFGVISSILFAIETHEGRKLDNRVMLIGLILLYVGTVGGFLLLGIAGVIGGYALVLEHSTVNATNELLSPYMNPITAASIAAVAGAAITIYGMTSAKATEP